MIGMQLPDMDRWSERVTVVLGQNPGLFTGPGTNTYLVGSGAERILLDTAQGLPEYLPVLERALAEAGCRIQEIVLTHGHIDHIGGVASVLERFGRVRVSKLPSADLDTGCPVPIAPISDGSVLRTEGATLRAVHAPGHSSDHLCFVLEEERALFSGDNVLGVGTTVIPPDGGDLGDYLRSLERLLVEAPAIIYPAHGPRIDDGVAKLEEYLAHRAMREAQIVEALTEGDTRISEIVERLYAAYPTALHIPAQHSVCSHLLKLEREGRVRHVGEDPLEARWSRT